MVIKNTRRKFLKRTLPFLCLAALAELLNEPPPARAADSLVRKDVEDWFKNLVTVLPLVKLTKEGKETVPDAYGFRTPFWFDTSLPGNAPPVAEVYFVTNSRDLSQVETKRIVLRLTTQIVAGVEWALQGISGHLETDLPNALPDAVPLLVQQEFRAAMALVPPPHQAAVAGSTLSLGMAGATANGQRLSGIAAVAAGSREVRPHLALSSALISALFLEAVRNQSDTLANSYARIGNGGDRKAATQAAGNLTGSIDAPFADSLRVVIGYGLARLYLPPETTEAAYWAEAMHYTAPRSGVAKLPVKRLLARLG